MASLASPPPPPTSLLRSFSEAEEDSTCSVHPPFLPFLSLSLSALVLLSSSPALHLSLSLFLLSFSISLPFQSSVVLSSGQPSSVSLVLSSIQMAKVNFAITKCRARRSPRYRATILARPTPPPPSGEAPIWSREKGVLPPSYPPPPTIQLYGGSRGAPELTPPLS